MRSPPYRVLALACILMAAGRPARAIDVITDTPSNGTPYTVTQITPAQITDPFYMNSGAQFEGKFISNDTGGVGGATIIAPNAIVTAEHLDATDQPATFTYNNTTYNSTGFVNVGNGVTLVYLNSNFQQYAPIFANSAGNNGPSAVGGLTSQYGYGVAADGPAVTVATGTTQGYSWGSNTGVLTWGASQVKQYFVDSSNNTYFGGGFLPNSIYGATYNGQGMSSQNMSATFATFDSGGGTFVNVHGVWELAGVNYGVDNPYYYKTTGSNGQVEYLPVNPGSVNPGFAAMFDQTGYYFYDPTTNSYIPASTDPIDGYNPQFWYVSNISQTVASAIQLAVPEPSALSLAACGGVVAAAGGLLRRRWRGRSPRS